MSVKTETISTFYLNENFSIFPHTSRIFLFLKSVNGSHMVLAYLGCWLEDMCVNVASPTHVTGSGVAGASCWLLLLFSGGGVNLGSAPTVYMTNQRN